MVVKITEEMEEKLKLLKEITGIQDEATSDMLAELVRTGEISPGRLYSLGGGMDASNCALLAAATSVMADAIMAKEDYRGLAPDELRIKVAELLKEAGKEGLRKLFGQKSSLSTMAKAFAILDPEGFAKSNDKWFATLLELIIREVEKRRTIV
jgi:hypothetical protein